MNDERVESSVAEAPALPNRRWDIDWLRIAVVVLMLVPFHSSRVFDSLDDWYVKNDQLSTALDWYLTFGSLVGMQLLFLLAGSASWFALRRRSAGQYAKERLQRLLVPFLFGLVVILPPQAYYGLRNHSGYAESLLRYYPRFFHVLTEDLNGYYLGGFTPGHLWFIVFLLVISLMALPLFVLLGRTAGKRMTSWLAAIAARPAVILMLFLPIHATRWLIRFDPNPLYFFVWFVYGFLFLTDERFGEAIGRHTAVGLIVGLVMLALVIAPGYGVLRGLKSVPRWSQILAYDVTSWFLTIGLLGYARRHLSSPPRRLLAIAFLGYVGEGSYSFYILHQTVIVAIGFYVVRWNASMLTKYLAILGMTYLSTILLYELLVRRIGVLRYLFGMKPKRRPPASGQ